MRVCTTVRPEIVQRLSATEARSAFHERVLDGVRRFLQAQAILSTLIGQTISEAQLEDPSEINPVIDSLTRWIASTLIHLADLSLTRIESPSEVVKVGDSIDVVVSHVEPGTHRIALHPALKGDAANEAPQKIQPHKAVKAKVVTIETGGLVVRILGVTGRNARGYVTAAGTGTQRGTELRKVFKPGQEIEGKVLEIDPRRGEIKLSIKALGEDNERNAYQQYRQQLKAEAKFTFGDLLNKTTPKR